MFTISRSEGPRGPGRPPRGALKLSLLTRSIKISLLLLSPHYHHNATVAQCPPTSLYCLALCLGFKVIERIGVGFGKVTLFCCYGINLTLFE